MMFFIALWGRIRSKTKTKSILFFGSIAQLSINNYKSKILNKKERNLIKEILEQAYINSVICNKKFKYYNRGIFLSIISTILCFLCLIFNII